jgi:hypothetical protein
MKKSIVAITLALTALGASAQLALPGANWSNVTYSPGLVKGSPEEDNVLLQGNLEQGAVWAQYNGWKVNTYASVAYSVDKNRLSYNNKLSPAVGVKLQRNFDSGITEIGVQAVHQRNYRGVTFGNKSGSGVQVYAQYWFGWDLRK